MKYFSGSFDISTEEVKEKKVSSSKEIVPNYILSYLDSVETDIQIKFLLREADSELRPIYIKLWKKIVCLISKRENE